MQHFISFSFQVLFDCEEKKNEKIKKIKEESRMREIFKQQRLFVLLFGPIERNEEMKKKKGKKSNE